MHSFVRRRFGLWKPRNPQSFASQRRLLGPQADLGLDSCQTFEEDTFTAHCPLPPWTQGGQEKSFSPPSNDQACGFNHQNSYERVGTNSGARFGTFATY